MKTYAITFFLVFEVCLLSAQNRFSVSSSSIQVLGISATSFTREMEKAIQVTPYHETFILGLPFDQQKGFRESSIDADGKLALIDDFDQAKLILRLEKVNTGFLNLKIYDRRRRLVYNRTVCHSSFGTQIKIDYGLLGKGSFMLVVKSDHGSVFRKKIAVNSFEPSKRNSIWGIIGS